MTDLIRPNVLKFGPKKQEEKDKDLASGLKVFSNYDAVPIGKKTEIVPKFLSKMLTDFKVLFPEMVNYGGKLANVVQDQDTGLKVLRYVEDECYLESMLNELDCFLDFRNDLDLKVKWKSFFLAFRNYAHSVKAVGQFPMWPLKPDHLVLGEYIEPKPSGAVDEFLNFFNFYTPKDRLMVKWIIASACWSEGQGRRPIFVICGPEGLDSTVQIGKSTLAAMIQYLFQSFGDLHVEVDVERFIVDLMAVSHERIVRLDNVKSGFRSNVLERLLTSPRLFGHVHGRGRISVENHVTFIITANDPSVTKDTATRSMKSVLAPPSLTAPFKHDEEYIKDFLDKTRKEIFGDAAYWLINPSRYPKRPGVTRFKYFEENIGQKFGDLDVGSQLIADIKSMNDESKIHEEFLDFLYGILITYKMPGKTEYPLNPDKHVIFVLGAVMAVFYKNFFQLRGERPPGMRGADIKRLCLAVGMHGITQKVQGDAHRGYMVNPKVTTGDKWAILQQRSVDRYAIPIKSVK